MESWRKVWREGLCPSLSTSGLEALRTALVEDDPRLLQGATTTPPPLRCVQDWPVESACLIGYPCTVDLGGFADSAVSLGTAATVGEVEEAFAQSCFDCGQRLGEPAGCRHLLNWFDETPRDEMRRLLLPEVEREIARRKGADA